LFVLPVDGGDELAAVDFRGRRGLSPLVFCSYSVIVETREDLYDFKQDPETSA
jgi:hypothetical protein